MCVLFMTAIHSLTGKSAAVSAVRRGEAGGRGFRGALRIKLSGSAPNA